MPIFEAVDEKSVKDLICCVCLSVWTDPVELKPCCHIFCRGCIGDRIVRCFMCRGNVEKTVEPNRILVNMADETEIRCCECDWRGPNNKKSTHKKCSKNRTHALAEATQHAMHSVIESRSPTPPPSEVHPPIPTINAPRVAMIQAPVKPRTPLLPPEQQRVPHSPAQLGPEPWGYYRMSQAEYDHTMAMFMAFDLDRNGRLDRGELEALAKYLNFAHSPRDITRMFESMDKDRNGRIDFHEFANWLQVHRPDPQALYGLTPAEYHEALFQFHEFDTENRGVLGPSDFKFLAVRQGYSANPVQAEELFRAIDTERNGVVDLHGLLLYLSHRKRMYEQMMQQYQQQRTQFQQNVLNVAPNSRSEVYNPAAAASPERTAPANRRRSPSSLTDSVRRPQYQQQQQQQQQRARRSPTTTQQHLQLPAIRHPTSSSSRSRSNSRSPPPSEQRDGGQTCSQQ